MSSVISLSIQTSERDDSAIGQFKHLKNPHLPIIVYETSKLLFHDKNLNSSASHGNIHLSIETDSGEKPIIYMIKNANTLSLQEINEQLSKNIDTNSHNSESDTTFTIMDLSDQAIEFFIPRISSGQSAALGLCRKNELKSKLSLILAFLPEAINDRHASEFLIELKSRIESFEFNDDTNHCKIETNSDAKCYKCLKSLPEDKALNGIGLISIMDHQGRTKLICEVCLTGH